MTFVIVIYIEVPAVTTPLAANAFTTLTESRESAAALSVIEHVGELGEKVVQLVVKAVLTIDCYEGAPRLDKLHFGKRIST